MTALGKLVRTTAFRLTLAYALVFAIISAGVLGYVAWNGRRLVEQGMRETVDAEVNGLIDQFRAGGGAGGIRRLVASVEQRTRRPGSSLYLLTTFVGEALAGNVARLPTSVLTSAGENFDTPYERLDDPEGVTHHAYVRVILLPGGFRLVVGRDLAELNSLGQAVKRAFLLGLVILTVFGLVGGFFVARRVLARIDSMTESANAIMAGELATRLPLEGSNDELDRLAASLNAMLDRIGALLSGLKEVSDNIAHDLKTPLTRLRSGAEEALRSAKLPQDYRQALERTIEESDQLISVFNALLMIARAEGGRVVENMAQFDAAEIARSVVELYEPIADEAGVSLSVEAPGSLQAHGNRELAGQALANLVDNALKYARGGEKGQAESAAEVQVSARANGDGTTEVCVSDHGPGIPEADRERVLERFVRLEGSRTRPGFGLGLSLAHAVMRLHGGSLRLEDNHPGLRATLCFPPPLAGATT
ncbi:MAG: HAMP domain-containing protein [Hyphomicrobiales bacterium]|nr:HAMP domain-containing protein [Hyphomicrobiales bacterium]MBV9520822.1 HAMP domain-containing protein [Hyphomicrobiales bacterium]